MRLDFESVTLCDCCGCIVKLEDVRSCSARQRHVVCRWCSPFAEKDSRLDWTECPACSGDLLCAELALQEYCDMVGMTQKIFMDLVKGHVKTKRADGR